MGKLKDSNGAYHLSPFGSDIGSQKIASRCLLVSNQFPSNLTKGSGSNLLAILFSNFPDLLIGMFGELEILTDPYSAFQSETVEVRALQAVDIAVRHPESFAAMQDAIA